MKKQKVLLTVMTAAAMAGVTACSSPTPETTAAPETTAEAAVEETAATEAETAGAEIFEASAAGYGGDVKLQVTIENGAVTDLVLGENHESNVVIDRAFPVIRERILEAGTPVVDSVSGATFSSYAVKAATADAMKQAGLEVEDITMTTAGPEKEAVTLEDVNADIVIVGGGPSGLAAAITAKAANQDADIILIEKMDILSGNGKFDMNFYDLINSEAQKAAGNEKWTVNQVENFKKEKANTGDGEARVAVWAEQENELDAWLRSMGVELDYNYGAMNHMAKEDQYAGEVIQAGMEKQARAMDLDIRTGTKGTDLIMENGRCLGVTVTNNQNESYRILAQNTIIATGGFCSSKELLAEYAPGFEAFNTSNQMGTTGDFVEVFKKNGFKLEQMDNIRLFPDIIVPRRDLTGGSDMSIRVNKNGERFMDENSGQLERGNAILAQPDGAAYLITDQTGYDSFYRIRKHVEAGYYAQGETIEELAEALRIDADGLKKTIEKFNAVAETGENDEFTGKPVTRAFDDGPYYGVRVEGANHMTKGGVACNEKAQVLYEDGTLVEGLYASGEVSWQSGGYSQSVCFGRVAGQQAAENLK